MAWIESHQELDDHPKTRKAALMLGVSVPAIIGHLHILWHWALSYASNGDLTDFSAEDIALAARWEDDPEAFINAMVNCRLGNKRAGFLERTEDGRLLIHDWWEYAGKLVAKRQADAERKRNERASAVHSTSDGCPSAVAGTQPTQPTVPNSTIQTSLLSDDNAVDPLTLAKPSETAPAANEKSENAETGLTEGQRYFLSMFSAKRYKTNIQRETIGKLEVQYGMSTLRPVVEWAAKQGMNMGRAIPAVEKAITHWGQPRTPSGNGASIASRPDPQMVALERMRNKDGG